MFNSTNSYRKLIISEYLIFLIMYIMISLFLLDQPHLCSLIVGENSFQSCKKCDFKSVFFDNSSQIGTLSIGNHSFTQANLFIGSKNLSICFVMN